MLVTATGGTGTGPSSTLRATSSEAPVSVSDPKRKIEFTVYPNPNRGVFTVDFSGIENNHEVEILLCNIENGQIVYKTTFLSQSTEHNKVDVVPSPKFHT